MAKKLLSAIVFIFLIACNEDKPTDVREQSIGNYSYIVQITLIADRNIVDSDNGLLEISAVGTNGLLLVFDKGTIDELSINVTGVTPATNGFTFNIQSAFEIDGDGDQFQIIGMNTVTISGQSYHGKFDSGSKQLTFGIQTDYVNSIYDDFNVEIEVIATKL